MNFSTIYRCATVLFASIVSAAAIAGDTDPKPSNAVNFADLNLNSPAGVSALYQRIERAADRVCELPRETHQLKIEFDLKTCKSQATDRAVFQLGLPALSALHRAKTGRTEELVRVAKQK